MATRQTFINLHPDTGHGSGGAWPVAPKTGYHVELQRHQPSGVSQEGMCVIEIETNGACVALYFGSLKEAACFAGQVVESTGGVFMHGGA